MSDRRGLRARQKRHKQRTRVRAAGPLGFIVAGQGDVEVVMRNGDATVIRDVPAVTFMPFRVRCVLPAGTTAKDVYLVYGGRWFEPALRPAGLPSGPNSR